MATFTDHATTAVPSPLSTLPRELLDRILDALWTGTSLRIYDQPHVITISYKAGVTPRAHIPNWLLTSKSFFSAGLAQFRRHAVITCIKPIKRLEKPIYANIGRDKLLLQSAKEIELDVAVRCDSKFVQKDSTFDAFCLLKPRFEYWCILTPSDVLVRKILPGLEILTFLVEVQQLEWVGEPSSIYIVMGEFKTLGARWKNVRIEIARPIIDCDDAQKIHVGSLDALFTRVQRAVAHMGSVVTHLYTSEQQRFEEGAEKALDDLYEGSSRAVGEVSCPLRPSEVKDEKLQELLRMRQESSGTHRRSKDWIDAETGTWSLEISFSDDDDAQRNQPTPQPLNAIGLHSFLAPTIHPTTSFTRDRSPRAGTISYSCVDFPDTIFYTDGDESGIVNADDERCVCHQPAQPTYRIPSSYSGSNTINAPERRKVDHAPDWVRPWGATGYSAY